MAFETLPVVLPKSKADHERLRALDAAGKLGHGKARWLASLDDPKPEPEPEQALSYRARLAFMLGDRSKYPGGYYPNEVDKGFGGPPLSFKTKEAANVWGATTQGWVKDATPEQIEGVRSYTVMTGLNEDLRRGREATTHKTDFASSSADQLKALDALMAHPDAVLPNPVVAYRSWAQKTYSEKTATGREYKVDPGPIGLEGTRLAVGTEFIDHGFTSTAVAKEGLTAFAGSREYKAMGATTVEIRVPAGTRALYLGAHADPTNKRWLAESSELLLNRGTRYRVVDQGTPRKPMVLEVVP